MPDDISGLHHVTAITSDPERNVAFYTGVLGLRDDRDSQTGVEGVGTVGHVAFRVPDDETELP